MFALKGRTCPHIASKGGTRTSDAEHVPRHAHRFVKPGPANLRLIAAAMRTAALSFLVLAAAMLTGGDAAARRPVVVELFTAQGCSSCAPANLLINTLADQPDVIALTYGVDYWDYLGWEDTFARPEFAQRQRDYIRRLSLRDVFTPQVVVNGRAQAAGVRPAAVERLVTDAGREPGWNPPQVRLVGANRVAVGSGPRPVGGAEVWLVRFDPRQQTVEIRQGDNRGQTVTQRNVVRQAQRLGTWTGRPVLLRAPAAPGEGLRTLVLVQSNRDGRILAAYLPDAPAP